MDAEWILCPLCGGKTRDKIREGTVLVNYPLYCPKCKHECLIKAEHLHITVIKEPAAKTQSRARQKILCKRFSTNARISQL